MLTSTLRLMVKTWPDCVSPNADVAIMRMAFQFSCYFDDDDDDVYDAWSIYMLMRAGLVRNVIYVEMRCAGLGWYACVMLIYATRLRNLWACAKLVLWAAGSDKPCWIYFLKINMLEIKLCWCCADDVW